MWHNILEHWSEWAKLIGQEAVVGLSIGGVIGLFAAIARKRPGTSAWPDALLGALGFVGGAMGVASMRWGHTTTTRNVGGMIVSTTTIHYPHPYRVALAAALILPVLLELFRAWRERAKAREIKPVK